MDRGDPTSPLLGERKPIWEGYVGQAAIPPGPVHPTVASPQITSRRSSLPALVLACNAL